MRVIAAEPEARLTYLKRQLVRRVKRSRDPDKNICSFCSLTREIPPRAEKLAREIKELAGGTSHAG